MSDFTRFFRENKTPKSNEKYQATKSLCDEKNNPLVWEFRHISSQENSLILDEVGELKSTKNKASEYLHKLITRSVVYPDLYDEKLQNSYNTRTPEQLLYALVDDIGEYNSLCQFVQKMQGITPLESKVRQAKN